MIKTIIPAVTLLSLSLSSFTYAMNITKPEGWYTALSWGNAFNQVFDSSKSNDNANNPLINASIGYKKDSFRIEGQYGYQSHDLYTYYANNRVIRTSQGHVNSLAINGYYDFDNQTPFSPYLGIGIAGQKEYIKHNSFFNNTSNDISFTPMLHLGVRAYMTENLAFDMGYHVNRFNDGVGAIGIAYHF